MKQPGPCGDGEAGSTLLIAMMVMGVAVALSLLVLNVATGTSETTGGDRQRLTAVNAAEAGVDAAYAKIQTSGALLPCSWPDYGPSDVKTAPDRTETSASIGYLTATSTVPACPLPLGEVPVRAVITGTGTTTGGGGATRRMEAVVDMRLVTATGLDKGMFGDMGLSLTNNATVTPSAGGRADVYSNGDFFCDSSPTFQGSIIAPYGTITMANSCAATGDVWASKAVTLSGGKTIGGRVVSSTEGITATNNTIINGTLMARQSISWTGCAAPAKCIANQSATPAPPVSPFPELRGDATTLAAWQAAPGNFQVVPIPTTVSCGRNVGNWLKARVGTLSSNTLYTTDCAVEFKQTQDIPFSADVAVFAKGGISTSNQVGLSSTTSAIRNVYFVQPFDAVASRPCVTNPVMGPTQQFSSTPQISLLWYSPCDISYGNQGGSYGQVYSGSTLTTNQQYTLTVRQVPIYGLTPSATPATTAAYTIDIVHKREVR